MFAVFQTGGKQYKVTGDDIILVEKLAGDPGKTIDFSDVLMVGGGGTASIGAPLLGKAKVTAEILEQTRGEKQIVFKKKRRHTYRRKKGHRQELTCLRITSIELDGKQVAKAEKPAPKKKAAMAASKPERKAGPKAAAKAEKPASNKASPAGSKKAPAKKAPAKESGAAKSSGKPKKKEK